MSRRILFVNDWRFHDGEIEVQRPALKGPVYTQAKTESYRFGPAAIYYEDRPNDFGNHKYHLTHDRWDTVTLPHDYIINSKINPDGNCALGFYDYRPAWYRKHFKADEEMRGKRIEIEFLGVATECDVYFNGVYMTRNTTAYTPFVVDISDFIKFDGEDNVIAVHTTCETIENWWYNGAGICHKVYLCVSEPVAVERDGVYLCPTKLSDTEWQLKCEVEIRSAVYEESPVRCVTEIFAPDGTSASEMCGEVNVPARDSAAVSLDCSVISPFLWDVDSPNLYRAKTEIFVRGEKTDERWDTFGFRTIEFDSERGFMLNGRRLTINGVCGHEDFSLTGKALSDNVMRAKVRLIKEMGANAYRCAHSMQDEALMDAFDRYGILVMAETRHFSSTPAHLAELRALVKRDRNRPSVFMWSVGNEEHYFVKDEGRRIAENMIHEVRRLDNTRPIMTANDKSPEICTVYEVSDLVAVNYNPHLYDYLHEKYPDKPLFVSECSAASGTRGWYYGECPEAGRRSAYDRDVNSWFQSHENVFVPFRTRPWIMGAFVWSAIEYLGEAVWPRICSCSGAIDLYLQKKDAFYQLKTYFTDEPLVHILPHWNMDGEENVKVFVYDNCASVELFLNGRSLGRQSSERFVHHEWDVAFEAGELLCIGYNERGEEIARDVRVTSGPAYALKLRLENEGDVCYNGEDLALFTCYVVDSEGREVPDAEPTVTFITDEGVKIVGTGSDNTDHTPPACPTRRMWAGRALAALLPIREGTLTLTAKAQGLKTARISVDIPKDKSPVEGRVYPKYVIRW